MIINSISALVQKCSSEFVFKQVNKMRPIIMKDITHANASLIRTQTCGSRTGVSAMNQNNYRTYAASTYVLFPISPGRQPAKLRTPPQVLQMEQSHRRAPPSAPF